MRLGITMRVVENDTYPERRDALSQEWPDYINRIFPESVLIPLHNRMERIDNVLGALELDGVILSNGNDWGDAPERDTTERRVVNYCHAHDLPLLGICRGLQVLNILYGGQLEEDIKGLGKDNHVAVEHDVNILSCPFIPDTDPQTLRVNSFHAQGVVGKGVATEVRVFATANDGVVEGFYHPDKPIVAIQWHPERQGPSADYNKALIKGLFCS